MPEVPDEAPDQTLFEEGGGWPSVLATVSSGQDLDRAMAEATMAEVLAGRATDAQLGGLLVGLRLKGEAVGEIDGFVTAMQAAAIPLRVPDDAIDIVGTGGSPFRRKHALNVSTMACFVAAAAGATICKHGNRKASSTSGSSDFLEALGIEVELDSPRLEACIEQTRVGFAFARAYHPAMRFAGPVRSQLGVPTVFNILGPLANPGRVNRQLIGTATAERAESVARVLEQRSMASAWVVTGDGGLDELTTTGRSVIFRVGDGEVDRFELDPADVGMKQATVEELAGGGPAENAAIFARITAGERCPQADIVVLNAGAGLVVAGLADDLEAGIEKAWQVLDSGAVAQTVDAVRAASTTTAG